MSETDRTLGLVKWFNSKYGYGFITALEGDKKDIFVHYSALSVGESQYKYLVQGEYVEFELIKSTNDKHEFQAVNISGIKGGPIMCETRFNTRQNGDETENVEEDITRSPPQPVRRRPTNTSGPRKTRKDTQDGDFVTVEKKTNKRRPTTQK